MKVNQAVRYQSQIVGKCKRPAVIAASTIAKLSATGAHGHVVQVVDAAEESFPYSPFVVTVIAAAAAAAAAAVLTRSR